jgi:hypothetical protein
MTMGKKHTADAGQPPRDQRTTAHGGIKSVSVSDEPELKQPHERDQSPGNADDAPRGEGKKAYADVERGVPDMDKGPVMDKAYHKVRKGS